MGKSDARMFSCGRFCFSCVEKRGVLNLRVETKSLEVILVSSFKVLTIYEFMAGFNCDNTLTLDFSVMDYLNDIE